MSTATQAQAIAERIIRGSLTQTTHTDELHYPDLDSRYLFLDEHPITSVTSLNIAGTAITASNDDGYTVERFFLKRKYGYVWPAGTKISVTYVTGWATAGDYPSEITEAIAALTTWLDSAALAGPASALQRVQVDDIVEVRDASIPEIARTLLAPWVRHPI